MPEDAGTDESEERVMSDCNKFYPSLTDAWDGLCTENMDEESMAETRATFRWEAVRSILAKLPATGQWAVYDLESDRHYTCAVHSPSAEERLIDLISHISVPEKYIAKLLEWDGEEDPDYGYGEVSLSRDPQTGWIIVTASVGGCSGSSASSVYIVCHSLSFDDSRQWGSWDQSLADWLVGRLA